MAKTKIPFSKLSLKKLEEVETVNINDLDIEVRQYLPIEEKLQLISDVIMQSADGNNFLNPLKADVFTYLNIIFYYTNITFTDKQKEDPGKLFDLLSENGVVDKLIAAIPKEEFGVIYNGVYECAESLYAQLNSAKGVFEAVLNDYENMDLSATEIQEKLANTKNISLLKDILEKLG